MMFCFQRVVLATIILTIMVMVEASSFCLEFPGTKPGRARASADRDSLTLSNSVISVSWSSKDGRLRPVSIGDKISKSVVQFDQASSEAFVLELGDGRTIRASDCKLVDKPRIENLKVDKTASRVEEHYGGKQIVVDMSVPGSELHLQWRGILRDGSNYVRQSIVMSASTSDIMVKRVVLIFLKPKSAADCRVAGLCNGSPIVLNDLFLAYEHANSDAAIHQDGVIEAGLDRNSCVKPGAQTVQTSVIGVTPASQLRRGFLYYIERERAYPYRPFMHYNSWYDLGDTPDEAGALNVIDRFGEELVRKRGVKLACFAWDDGWDDPKSLWQINKAEFPHGWAPLVEEGKKFGIPMGLWMSPFGGYGEKRTLRAQYAKTQGIEIGPDDMFSLAQQKYRDIFVDTSKRALRDLGCVYFKYDGLSASKIEETEAAFKMIDELRKIRPNLFINLTSGTWSSPFYLLYGDSTWRNGQDTDYEGKGTLRNRWITYRDAQTYKNVVTTGPLYPLNSLMYHGFIVARTEDRAVFGTDPIELRNDMHAIFGSGTATLELYITPSLMTEQNWDDLAETAKWYLSNSDLLVDTHWVGGDPAKGEIYGWASWSKRGGVLTLRNPSDSERTISVDLGNFFQLPEGAEKTYVLTSPWKSDEGKTNIAMRAGEPQMIKLSPFDVLVLNATPVK